MFVVFNRFTRAQYAMTSCSTIIVHEDCFVLLHTVKVNVSVVYRCLELRCVFNSLKLVLVELLLKRKKNKYLKIDRLQ